jgi:hypothetical protein
MSLPHFSIGLLIVVAVAYVVGARWPMIAQKVGLA